MTLKQLIKDSFEKSELNKESKEEHFTFYVWEMAFNMGFSYGKSKKQMPIEFYKEVIFENAKLKELIKLEYQVTDKEYIGLLNKFYLEKSAINTCYPDKNSLLKHCVNYLKYNLNNKKPINSASSRLL